MKIVLKILVGLILVLVLVVVLSIKGVITLSDFVARPLMYVSEGAYSKFYKIKYSFYHLKIEQDLADPRTYHVVSPEAISVASKNKWSYVGCGADVDWGDGKEDPVPGPYIDCPLIATHTYDKPGIYQVKAEIGQGGIDTYSVDWTDTVTLEVK